MNRKQKVLTFIAIGVFFLSVVAAPWRVDYKSRSSGHIMYSQIVYDPVFSAPALRPSQQTDYAEVSTLLWQPLLFTWIAIAIAYAGLFFLVRSKRELK